MKEDSMRKLISNKVRIYIDTSALMDSNRMKEFFRKYYKLFMKENKRIIILNDVYFELLKHMDSDKQDKTERATRAIDLLAEYNNIIEYELADTKEDLNEEAVYNAFADMSLLVRLIINKADENQIIITNDKGLGRDAIQLNEQESYKGRSIKAYYLNEHGELRKHTCNHKRIRYIERVVDISSKEGEIEDIEDSKDEGISSEEKNKKENSLLCEYGIPVATFFIGGVCFKYGGLAIKYVIKELRRKVYR